MSLSVRGATGVDGTGRSASWQGGDLPHLAAVAASVEYTITNDRHHLLGVEHGLLTRLCTFVMFHCMPIVRMNTRDADALVEAYDRAATEISNAIPSLSGLISQAHELLNMPGQNSVHGPLPALHATKLELTKDSRDLAWRVDWLKNADAQPLGVDGQVQAYAPGAPGPNSTFDLDAALKDAGLTEEEAQRAKAAILRGADFSDAIEDEKQRTCLLYTSPSPRDRG